MNYKLALDQAPAGRVVDPNASVRACAYRGPHRGGASSGPPRPRLASRAGWRQRTLEPGAIRLSLGFRV